MASEQASASAGFSIHGQIISRHQSLHRVDAREALGSNACGKLIAQPAAEGAMRVYEVMSKAVETVKPNVAASEAKTRMRQKKIHHLVVTQGTQLAGIVSERDLGGGKLPKTLGTWTVADLMSSPVQTVTTRTTIRRAATLMTGRSIGSLVVTSASGKVAGIVTMSDLLNLLARQPEHRSNRDRRRAEERLEPWDE
jgi:CBS domain-containing protein